MLKIRPRVTQDVRTFAPRFPVTFPMKTVVRANADAVTELVESQPVRVNY